MSLQPYSIRLQQYSMSLQPYSKSLQPYTMSLQSYSISLQKYSRNLQPYSMSIQPSSLDRTFPMVQPQIILTNLCLNRLETFLRIDLEFHPYIGFKMLFYVVRHLDSIASYLPIGLHLGFFRSWPSLYLPSSISSVFLVLSVVSASTSMLF
jgi:hypothetical protein